MTKRIFFSIIIPLYNAEYYIARCLKSCIRQTFDELEIIIINDCSTDNSLQIAQKYAQQSAKIKIIDNPHNLGPFQTRIIGANCANGLYILFVDADDFLEHTTCEILKNAIVSSSQNNNETVDICSFNMKHYPAIKKRITQTITKTCIGSEILKNFFIIPKKPPWSIWGKAYKSSILKQANKFIFDNIEKNDMNQLCMGEDILYFFIITLFSQKSTGVKSQLYAYCHNNTSITRQTDDLTMKKKSEQLQKIIDIFCILKTNEICLSHPFCLEAISKIINILKHSIEIHNAHSAKPFAYLIAHTKSLKYSCTWKTYVRILIYLISLGSIKI